jgi:hypothetical protein
MLKYSFILLISTFIILELRAQRLPELIPYNDHGKWGYADTTGQLKIPLKFDRALPFYHGVAVVGFKKAKEIRVGGNELEYSIIDQNGENCLLERYEYIEQSDDGSYFIVQKNNLYGIIDKSFQLITPCSYDKIHPYQHNLARVNVFGYYGVIDREGNSIVPCMYRFIYPFSNGFACFVSANYKVTINNSSKFGYLNEKGKIVINPIFDEAGSFYNGFAYVKQGSLYLRINTNGDVFSQYDYTKIENFTDGIALVKKKEKIGFINSDGIEIVPCEYVDAIPFSEGFGCLKKGGLWFYINRKGQRAFPGDFAEAYPFSEGLAMVVKQNHCGFIDTSGKLISQYRWNNAGYFREGYAWIEISNYYGLINKNNQLLIKPKYRAIGDCENGICPVYPTRKAERKLSLNAVMPDTRYFYIDKYGREYYNGAVE